MDKVDFYNFLFYGFIATLAIGFVWFIVADIVGNRLCIITSKDIVDGELAPSRNINKTTPWAAKNMTPQDWESSYWQDNGFLFERNLGRVHVDRSLKAEAVVVRNGTHLVVSGRIAVKHLVASNVIEQGRRQLDWDPKWFPKYGIAEATEIIVG